MTRPKRNTILPGERWRGTVDGALCVIALPDEEVERWTYLEFDPSCPTLATWFKGDWINVAGNDVEAVYAAAIRDWSKR